MIALVTLIERYQKLVKECNTLSTAVVTDKATLVEKQKRLKEYLDAIKNEFGVEPSEVEAEIVKMEQAIEREIKDVVNLLQQVNDASIVRG